MIFHIEDVSEAAAYNALSERENFPSGTTARCTDMALKSPGDLLDREPPLFTYTFDVTVPERKAQHSVAHPYEDTPMSVSTAATLEQRLAIAGYAAHHAPSQDEANKIGRVAMFVRTFDRHGGAATIRHYRGCMTH